MCLSRERAKVNRKRITLKKKYKGPLHRLQCEFIDLAPEKRILASQLAGVFSLVSFSFARAKENEKEVSAWRPRNPTNLIKSFKYYKKQTLMRQPFRP